MMQNSAVSFSVCVDNDSHKVPPLLKRLKEDFKVHFNENLIMYTIRHYDKGSIAKLLINKELVLEQKSQNTIHLVVKDK